MWWITRRATFLNWFIALNCLSLFNTALSRGVSGASPSSLIHGWSDTNHSYACNNLSSIKMFKLKKCEILLYKIVISFSVKRRLIFCDKNVWGAPLVPASASNKASVGSSRSLLALLFLWLSSCVLATNVRGNKKNESYLELGKLPIFVWGLNSTSSWQDPLLREKLRAMDHLWNQHGRVRLHWISHAPILPYPNFAFFTN